MERRVTRHSLAWNPNSSTGYARIILEGVDAPYEVPVHSPQDLSALAGVLNSSSVFLREEDGLLYTDWEPVAG